MITMKPQKPTAAKQHPGDPQFDSGWGDLDLALEKDDQKFISDLIIIIGGFILTETIIRQFLELTTNIVAWWVLPALGLDLLMGGTNLKRGRKSGLWMAILFIILILLIGLYKKTIITGDEYIYFTLAILIIFFIGFLISFFFKKKNKIKKNHYQKDYTHGSPFSKTYL